MNMPFAYMMTCSETSLGDFAAATLNRLAEEKKARREIDDRIAELEGTAQLVEWLRTRTHERTLLLSMDFPQHAFKFIGGGSAERLAIAGPLRGHRADAAQQA